MNLDKFTQKSQEAILGAQQIAQEHRHQAIEPVHRALALVRQEGGVVPAVVIQLDRVARLLEDKGFRLQVSPQACQYLAEVG
jgi:ATP-dependent Clp protease ATP-binding subunit ClpA